MTRSRASAGPSLLSRPSPQSGTGSNRPAEDKHTSTKSNIKFARRRCSCWPEDADEKERSRTAREVENTGPLR